MSRESPFDSLASEYDSWFEEEGKLIFDIEVQAFREILPLLPKPWLEIGVGSGRFAQALSIETGIDPSAELLEMAKRRAITAFRARGENDPFRKETFGTVFLILTLCFVDSPPAILREAYRILKRDGKITLGMVLQESPWGQWYQLKKSRGHRFYEHATFYSYREVNRLLEQTGFSIETVISTLFQKPGEVRHMDSLQQGYYPGAGFTVIVAGKSPLKREKSEPRAR